MTSHPHADMIRAVLDGKTVQQGNVDGWWDLTSAVVQVLAAAPAKAMFRIKPPMVERWAAVMKNGDGNVMVGCMRETREGAIRNAGPYGLRPAAMLRVEIDPDTLKVVDARTEPA